MIHGSVGQLVEGKQLRSISDDKSVYDACSVLDQFNIGALAVMRDATLVGIISERDVIRRVIVPGRHFVHTAVGEVMTPDPQVIEASAGLADALTKMLEGNFRHLPVVRNGAAVGMISIRSIPVEYWYMRRRYEAIIATPAVVAEAAFDQHQHARPNDED